MSHLHITRPVHDVWIAQVRLRCGRRWLEIGRYPVEQAAAIAAVTQSGGEGTRFRVLADSREPSYYDPLVVLEGRHG